MSTLALLCLILSPMDDARADKAKSPPPAKVTITAELACLHCTFGEGDGCAVCLKLDDKTPVLLEGKAAEPFFKDRLKKKVLVAEGTLTRNQDKRLVLTLTAAHECTDKDKGKAPDKGQVRIEGQACCGHCDLGLCDECTLALRNGSLPIVLDGKLAAQHAEEGKEGRGVKATGPLFLDARGLLRLDARSVDLEKPGKSK
jgi:hypothetical protein